MKKSRSLLAIFAMLIPLALATPFRDANLKNFIAEPRDIEECNSDGKFWNVVADIFHKLHNEALEQENLANYLEILDELRARAENIITAYFSSSNEQCQVALFDAYDKFTEFKTERKSISCSRECHQVFDENDAQLHDSTKSLMMSLLSCCPVKAKIQDIEEMHPEDTKYGTFRKCMCKSGVQTWKVVDSMSNSSYYNTLNYQWNKYFEKVYPIAIFVPTTVSDVQEAVRCGYKAKILLTPNSGQHSYAGLSVGTDDSIIIDFRYMKSIKMNKEERSVTIGPGAFIGQVHAELYKNDGWFVPAGICMTVALGGHAIGGGIGYLSPLYGLVIDNTLEFEMVDALGNLVIVNAKTNTDLWWALRGVGPGYIGLITSVKLKMRQFEGIKYTFVQVRYKIKDFQDVMGSFDKWLDWVKENEPSIASVVYAVNDNYSVPTQPIWRGVEVQLLHVQDPAVQPNDSSKLLAAFPKFFANPVETVINYPTYLQLIIATGYTPVTKPPPPHCLECMLDYFLTLTKEMARTRYFFAHSFYVKDKFRSEDLDGVQQVMNQIPNNMNGLQISSEQGAIGDPKSDASSYYHRNDRYNIRLFFENDNGEEVAVGKKWAKSFLNATKFMDSGETYQNFPDIELKDYLKRYYGANLKRLIEIKRKWDPKGYFNSTMSIPIY